MRAKGRAGDGSALPAFLAAAAVSLAVAGCAGQGDGAGGTPEVTYSVHASAVPGPSLGPPLPVVPGRPGGSCADPAQAIPKPSIPVERSRGAGPNDAGRPSEGTKPGERRLDGTPPRGEGPNDQGVPRPYSGAAYPGGTHPGAAHSSAAYLGAAHSSAAHSSAAHPGAAHSGAAHSGAANSSAAHFGGTQSGATRSGADRPAAAPAPAPRATTTDDPAERARKALEAQQTPIPRRGEVPPAAIPGAEDCVRLLQQEFTLLAASGGTPTEDFLRDALTRAGLQNPVIKPGPKFAASTGKACVIGTFTGRAPHMEIAPLGPSGTCSP